MDETRPADAAELSLEALHSELTSVFSGIKQQFDRITEVTGQYAAPQQQVRSTANAEETMLDAGNVHERTDADAAHAVALNEVEHLRVQVHDLSEQLKRSRIRAADAEKAMEAAKQRAEDLQGQNTRFRTIITKEVNTIGQVVDMEVIAAYGDLRAKIQTLVHQYCSKAPLKLQSKARLLYDNETAAVKAQREFFSQWTPDMPEHSRQYRLRAEVFGMIHHDLLTRRCFGVEPEMEKQMRAFESLAFNNVQDRMTEFMEWRCRTVRCAQWSPITPDRPEQVADRIIQFLQPVWADTMKQNAPERLEKMVDQICKLAFDISVKVRQSTEEFVFEMVSRDTPFQGYNVSDLHPQDNENPKADPVGCRVLLTLTAALAKYPDAAQNRRDRHLLDKAHVILY